MVRRKGPALRADALRVNREQVARLGSELRTSRNRRHLTQRELGERVGLSQSAISLAERGMGSRLSLDTWQVLFLAVDRRLYLDASRDPAEGPADATHLAMQELALRIIKPHRTIATVELSTRPQDPRRSADVACVDDRTRLITLVECWNAFGDVGASLRSTDRKAAEAEAIATARWGEERHRVRSVWVVRATRQNRELVGRYPELFSARFRGSSFGWVRALETGTEPPSERGLVWCDVAVTRLFPWRRPSGASPLTTVTMPRSALLP